LFSVLIFSANALEVDSMGIVQYVVDGDTIDVLATSGFMNGSEYRIRFADINAPELDTKEGQEAKSALKSLLYGKTVYIDVDNLTTYDPYGRVVAVIYLPINETHVMNVNYYMVLNNYSVIWNFTNNEFYPYSWILYNQFQLDNNSNDEDDELENDELEQVNATTLEYNYSTIPLFEDNFDYFDITKWYDYDNTSFGSIVVKNYSWIDKNCLSFENGTAIISIYYDSIDDKFHSYYMESYQEMGYGIYEAKMRFTKTPYCNFAFWLYSLKDIYRDYKNDSEIDWESDYHNGTAYIRTNYFFTNLFDGKPWSGFQIHHNESELNISRSDWHIYKIETTPTYIKWYIDDKLIRTAPGNMTVIAYNTTVSESPENLTESDTLRIFFDAAIVPNYDLSIENENYTGYLYIDWVKYYPLEGYVNYTYNIDHLPYDIRKPGTYILTKNFTYENNETPITIFVNDVVIDGNGHTLEGNLSCSAIYSNIQRNITIKNINLKNWNIGIELRHVNNSKIENVSVESSDYGMLLWTPCNADINKVCVFNCSRGAYIRYADNVSLENLTMKNAYTGIEILDSSNASLKKIMGQNNTYCVVIQRGNNIKISNIKNLENRWSSIVDSSHISIENFTSRMGYCGIYTYNVSNGSISNFNGENNTYDLLIGNSNYMAICNIKGCDSYRAITIYDYSDTINIKNVFSNASTGVYLSSSSRMNITNVSAISKYDIVIKYSNNTTISNLNCYGLYNTYAQSSKNLTIENSFFTHNLTGWGDGFRLLNSSSIIIKENTILNKPSSFYIDEYSAGNYIYLNNFINNTYKYCKNHNNSFESPDKITYKFNNTTFKRYLGNYWSNYNGIDFDKDGVGDAPYDIDLNVSDTSPLIENTMYYYLDTKYKIPIVVINTTDNITSNTTLYNITDNITSNTTLYNITDNITSNTTLYNITDNITSNTTIHEEDDINDSDIEIDDLENITPLPDDDDNKGDETNPPFDMCSISHARVSRASSYHKITNVSSTNESKCDTVGRLKEIIDEIKLIIGSEIDVELSGKKLKDDYELTNKPLNIKEDCILVGGPMANPLTKKYIWTFKVKITNDYPGVDSGVIQKQMINGHIVILLAGSDRWGTKAAVEYFKTLDDIPDGPIFVQWNNGKVVKMEKH